MATSLLMYKKHVVLFGGTAKDWELPFHYDRYCAQVTKVFDERGITYIAGSDVMHLWGGMEKAKSKKAHAIDPLHYAIGEGGCNKNRLSVIYLWLFWLITCAPGVDFSFPGKITDISEDHAVDLVDPGPPDPVVEQAAGDEGFLEQCGDAGEQLLDDDGNPLPPIFNIQRDEPMPQASAPSFPSIGILSDDQEIRMRTKHIPGRFYNYSDRILSFRVPLQSYKSGSPVTFARTTPFGKTSPVWALIDMSPDSWARSHVIMLGARLILVGVQYAETISEEDFREIIRNGLAQKNSRPGNQPSIRLSFLLSDFNWRRRAVELSKPEVPPAMLAGTPSPQEEHLTEILLWIERLSLHGSLDCTSIGIQGNNAFVFNILGARPLDPEYDKHAGRAPDPYEEESFHGTQVNRVGAILEAGCFRRGDRSIKDKNTSADLWGVFVAEKHVAATYALPAILLPGSNRRYTMIFALKVCRIKSTNNIRYKIARENHIQMTQLHVRFWGEAVPATGNFCADNDHGPRAPIFFNKEDVPKNWLRWVSEHDKIAEQKDGWDASIQYDGVLDSKSGYNDTFGHLICITVTGIHIPKIAFQHSELKSLHWEALKSISSARGDAAEAREHPGVLNPLPNGNYGVLHPAGYLFEVKPENKLAAESRTLRISISVPEDVYHDLQERDEFFGIYFAGIRSNIGAYGTLTKPELFIDPSDLTNQDFKNMPRKKKDRIALGAGYAKEVPDDFMIYLKEIFLGIDEDTIEDHVKNGAQIAVPLDRGSTPYSLKHFTDIQIGCQ